MSEKPQNQSGGFTVRRRFAATAERVYAAFTEPAKLEQWFIVPGYRTPADRMEVDARPGGRVSAVMISDADGAEIPFGFSYGEIEPPHRVTLLFEQPRETVLLTLVEDESGVELAYEFVSWPAPTDESESRQGVERMLERIEEAVHRGII